MENIIKVSQAGIFYPADKDGLEKLIDGFGVQDSPYKSNAVIVPHAGLIYSGWLAAKGYSYLKRDVKNIFIFAPSHYVKIYGCVTTKADYIETPLGKIKINRDIINQLSEKFDVEFSDEAFEKEHSLETQLPFIQTYFSDITLVPVIYGCENYKNISKIIEYFDNDNNAFVISSDLSHFYPARENIRMDTYTANLIENNEIANFDVEYACGAVGICALMNYAKSKKYSLIRVGITNSAKSSGNTSSVVGYGSWFMYSGNKNNYIKEYYTKFVLDICKESILSGFQIASSFPDDYPCVLEEPGACFVSLSLDGNLRGCIGSVLAHRPLIIDLIKNAHSAAFADPRFEPLTRDEYDRIKIEVSLLSKPERIEFKSEDELLEKLVPFDDGLIIRDGNYQAVFLPCVWEQLPDKKEFLNALKQKAGLEESYFSETFTAFRFAAVELP